MPGAGLLGGDRRVGHQVHGGPDDAGAVAGEHDRAVHLAQLAQAGGGELDVEREAAGAERLDGLVVAEDDQRAGAAAQDALEAVAQRRAGRHGARVARSGSPLTPPPVRPRVVEVIACCRTIDAALRPWLGGRMRHRGRRHLYGLRTSSRHDRGSACSIASPRSAGVTARSSATPGLPTARVAGRPPRRRACPRAGCRLAGPQPGGTRAKRKPSRAASASRRPTAPTRRTSPVSPTSPIATRCGAMARLSAAGGHGERHRQVGRRAR